MTEDVITIATPDFLRPNLNEKEAPDTKLYSTPTPEEYRISKKSVDVLQNETEVADAAIEQLNNPVAPMPRNRAERRALYKKLGKQGRAELDLIAETTRKLNYVDLIQKLRAKNAEKENENEGTSQDS